MCSVSHNYWFSHIRNIPLQILYRDRTNTPTSIHSNIWFISYAVLKIESIFGSAHNFVRFSAGNLIVVIDNFNQWYQISLLSKTFCYLTIHRNPGVYRRKTNPSAFWLPPDQRMIFHSESSKATGISGRLKGGGSVDITDGAEHSSQDAISLMHCSSGRLSSMTFFKAGLRSGFQAAVSSYSFSHRAVKNVHFLVSSPNSMLKPHLFHSFYERNAHLTVGIFFFWKSHSKLWRKCTCLSFKWTIRNDVVLLQWMSWVSLDSCQNENHRIKNRTNSWAHSKFWTSHTHRKLYIPNVNSRFLFGISYFSDILLLYPTGIFGGMGGTNYHVRCQCDSWLG